MQSIGKERWTKAGSKQIQPWLKFQWSKLDWCPHQLVGVLSLFWRRGADACLQWHPSLWALAPFAVWGGHRTYFLHHSYGTVGPFPFLLSSPGRRNIYRARPVWSRLLPLPAPPALVSAVCYHRDNTPWRQKAWEERAAGAPSSLSWGCSQHTTLFFPLFHSQAAGSESLKRSSSLLYSRNHCKLFHCPCSSSPFARVPKERKKISFFWWTEAAWYMASD